MMDEADDDLLAYVTVSAVHGTELHATNPLERVKARSSAEPTSSASSDEDAIKHLVGGIRLEQSDGWAVLRSCCMTLESIAPIGNHDIVSLPIMAA